MNADLHTPGSSSWGTKGAKPMASQALMPGRVLEVEGLGHAYVPGRWTFRGLQLSFPRGGVLALLGPNGCGKTTLLKLLLGVLKPTEGRLRLAGRVGFVPQLFQVSFDYRVLDMVVMGRARRLGLFAQPSWADEAAAMTTLERLGLASLAQRSFQDLSGGQRQLVIMARALVAEAEVLLLDEPTASLDLRNEDLVLDWIDRLARQEGLTVIFTTHQPQQALAVADRALLMTGTERFVEGVPAEVLTEDRLRELYQVTLRRVECPHEGGVVRTLVSLPAVQLRRASWAAK